MNSRRGLYSARSIKLKEYSLVAFANADEVLFIVRTRSKFRTAEVVEESNLLNSMDSISSNFKMMVGLLMKIKAFASGYKVPSLGPKEHLTAAAFRADKKCFETNTYVTE